MDEWVAFLKARLDEDEAAAKAAASVGRLRWAALGGMVVDADDHDWAVTTDTLGEIAAHIAIHDPARALREVAAKRAILALHECAAAELSDSPGDPKVFGWARAAEIAAHDVAGIWSDHPDYPGR